MVLFELRILQFQYGSKVDLGSTPVKGRGPLLSRVVKKREYTEYTEQIQGYPEGLVPAAKNLSS